MHPRSSTVPSIGLLLSRPAPRAAAGWKQQPWRVAGRLGSFIAAMVAALADHFVTVRLAGRADSALASSRWAQRWCRCFVRILAVEVRTTGRPPTTGILVCNHQSYLDSLVQMAAQPVALVAKDDIAGWPLAGLLARLAGTIFINRRRRADVLRVVRLFPRIVHDGAVVGFFPEATCSDGRVILPFRSSLFAPAVRHDLPVTPARLEYRLDPGEGREDLEVCWWGGMEFLPHFLNLLAKSRIHVTLSYGDPQLPGRDRKQLARTLEERVRALGSPPPAR